MESTAASMSGKTCAPTLSARERSIAMPCVLIVELRNAEKSPISSDLDGNTPSRTSATSTSTGTSMPGVARVLPVRDAHAHVNPCNEKSESCHCNRQALHKRSRAFLSCSSG